MNDKIHKECIAIYLEALERIENISVAKWNKDGFPVSPGAIAHHAREKARLIAFDPNKPLISDLEIIDFDDGMDTND